MVLKASAAITTILILLFLSLSFTTLIFGQEVYVDPNTGISISFQINKRTFPESWKSRPINAYGENLDLSEYERSLKIVKKAISKYPAEVLKNNISKIYVLKTISFYGVGYGGTNSDNAVYIANNGIAMGFTDEYLEKTFHHEFSSILLRNYPEYFNEKLWTEQNSIHYGKGGVQAIKKGNDSQEFDSLLHLQGFLYQYAASDIENDFNSFAENLFLPANGFRDAVIRYARLTNKLSIIIAFYHSINQSFTLEYFENIEN